MNQQLKDQIEEVEALLLKDRPIRFNNRDIDNKVSLNDFLTSFFNIYNRCFPTIYVDDLSRQCFGNRNRSLADIYRICRYYYPSLKLIDLLFEMYKPSWFEGFVSFDRRPRLCSLFCYDINKRVFQLYSAYDGEYFGWNSFTKYGAGGDELGFSDKDILEIAKEATKIKK